MGNRRLIACTSHILTILVSLISIDLVYQIYCGCIYGISNVSERSSAVCIIVCETFNSKSSKLVVPKRETTLPLYPLYFSSNYVALV